MSDYIQIVTTTDQPTHAQRMADELVRRGLCACVQISGPIQSVYRWKGQIENAQEWILTAKTLSGMFGDVERAIRELHTYETPEVIGLPITHASNDYLTWLAAELNGHLTPTHVS